jgi:predicted acetylornithine/succinylornithine family transaminase
MTTATDRAPSPTVSPAAAAAALAPSALLGVYKRPPIEMVRGEGVRLYDAEGKAYLDFVSGIAVNALGYGDAGLLDALRRATDAGLIHTSNLYHTAPAEKLARRLVDLSFADRVFFCNSGAEANEGAFKFARKWARSLGGPSKHEIVSLRGAFHGRLFATVAATDRPQYRIPFRPLAGGVSIAERDLEELSAVLHSETAAALIVEPVQGEGGVRVLDAGFLRELRALTRERNVALVFDEIQCGLARTGRLFAYEHSGVEPDILTLAKPIAGGLPMGAVLMTETIAAPMQPGEHGTTFGGGPFVASVAMHVLDRLAAPAFLAAVRTNGEYLGARLRDLGQRTTAVRDVRGLGYMWGIDVTEPAAAIVGRALQAGLLIVTAGEHTLRLLPPLVTTKAELDEGLQLLERAIGG